MNGQKKKLTRASVCDVTANIPRWQMMYFMVSSIDLMKFLNKHFLDKKFSGRVTSGLVRSGWVWSLEMLDMGASVYMMCVCVKRCVHMHTYIHCLYVYV